MSEMVAIMTERDRQADERWKLMSNLMHHRDTDVDKRMVEVQDNDYSARLVALHQCHRRLT